MFVLGYTFANFVLLLTAALAYFYSTALSYALIAAFWIFLLPAAALIYKMDPLSVMLPLFIFSVIEIGIVGYKRSVKDEIDLWSKRLNKRRDEKNQFLEEFERLDNSENSIKEKETAIVNIYEITKKMSEDLRFEDIFRVFSAFLEESFGFKRCDLLIADRRYTISAKDAKGDEEAASITTIPLLSENEPVGTLVVENFPEEDIEKLKILAMQFALEIKKVLLYEMVEKLAITDSLTGLYVRRYFSERLNEEYQRSRRHKFNFSFLMIDIDNFKNCNDSYGHLVGDVVLKDIARLVKENVREIDLVGRYGGEEIAVVLTETGREAANLVAERIRKKVEESVFRAYDENLKLTVSIGVAGYPIDTGDVKGLIDKADKALYEAKKSGKNIVCGCKK